MFSWDILKAATNFEKHGISFEEAATVFSDPDGLDWEDLPYANAGTNDLEIRLLESFFVVYTVRRSQDDKETIRIISARHASRKERKACSGPSD